MVQSPTQQLMLDVLGHAGSEGVQQSSVPARICLSRYGHASASCFDILEAFVVSRLEMFGWSQYHINIHCGSSVIRAKRLDKIM
jgi:hypothetical protein